MLVYSALLTLYVLKIHRPTLRGLNVVISCNVSFKISLWKINQRKMEKTSVAEYVNLLDYINCRI